MVHMDGNEPRQVLEISDRFRLNDIPDLPESLAPYRGCTLEVVGISFGKALMTEVVDKAKLSTIDLGDRVWVQFTDINNRFIEKIERADVGDNGWL